MVFLLVEETPKRVSTRLEVPGSTKSVQGLQQSSSVRRRTMTSMESSSDSVSNYSTTTYPPSATRAGTYYGYRSGQMGSYAGSPMRINVTDNQQTTVMETDDR